MPVLKLRSDCSAFPGHPLVEDAIGGIPNYFFSIEIPPLPTLISMPVVFCRSW